MKLYWSIVAAICLVSFTGSLVLYRKQAAEQRRVDQALAAYRPEKLYRTSQGRYVKWSYVLSNCVVDSSYGFLCIVDTTGFGERARAANAAAYAEIGLRNMESARTEGALREIYNRIK